MRRLLFALALVLGLAAVWMGCGDDNVANTVYSCSDCSKTCSNSGESGCSFTCTGGSCSFTCPGGGCSAECKAASGCTLACPGDSCSLDCGDDTDTCKITECSSACALDCGGASDCSSSCGMTAGCTGGGL